MEGSKDQPGVIPRAFEHIFRHISDANKDEQYLVRSSYLEIYQEEVRDLSKWYPKKNTWRARIVQFH